MVGLAWKTNRFPFSYLFKNGILDEFKLVRPNFMSTVEIQ